jgi:putative superfamily III holin-X
MAASNNTRSIPDIFIDAVGQFTILVRKEARLARTELSEKIMDLGVGIGLLGGGSVLLIPALVILLQAAVAALVDAEVAMVWAALIVGGATLAIGVLLLATEVLRVEAANPVPRKTIAQLQHDGEMAKYQLRNDHGTTERAA